MQILKIVKKKKYYADLKNNAIEDDFMTWGNVHA